MFPVFDIPTAPDRTRIRAYRTQLRREDIELRDEMNRLVAAAKDPRTSTWDQIAGAIAFFWAAGRHVNVRARASVFNKHVAKRFPDVEPLHIEPFTF